MPSNKADFDQDIRRHYRQQGGQKSPYGQVAYRVITNSGNGHGWYYNGKSEDHQLSATGRSVECLGDNLQKSKTADSDPIQPAKLISAKHGDIVLDAMDGDIILKGDNIIIEANGIRNDNDGDIMLKANKAIAIDASDVKIDASNVRIVAIKDFSIVAKCYGDIVAGFLNVTQASDFGGSTLLGKITSVAKSLGVV